MSQLHTCSKVEASHMDQLCIIENGSLQTGAGTLLPLPTVCGNLLWHWDEWDQPWTHQLQLSVCLLALHDSLGSGATPFRHQQWLQWAWAQVSGTYRKAMFIAVEVYSNPVEYLQSSAALPLLAVCSCCLKPSVESGFPSLPPACSLSLLPSKLHWTPLLPSSKPVRGGSVERKVSLFDLLNK